MSAREPNPHLEAALRYAAAGWPVFPCVPGEKVPVTSRGYLDASTDPDRIRQWWGRNPARNIAVATGAPGPDVIDVDDHGPAGNGFGAYNRLKRAGLVTGPLAVVRTPHGGIHAFFAGTQQRTAHIPAAHIDFLSQGGAVTVAPSTVGGKPYVVVQHQPGTATVDWEAARQVLDPRLERKPQRQWQDSRPRDVSHLAAWVGQLEEGNRNNGLYWAACRAVEAGDLTALDDIARAAAGTGLDERSVSKTIASARRGASGRYAARLDTARHFEPGREAAS